MHHYIDALELEALKTQRAHLSIQSACEYEGRIYQSPETVISIAEKSDLAEANRTIDDVARVIATEAVAEIDALKLISTTHQLTLFLKDDAGKLLKEPTVQPLILSASFGR